MKNVKNGILDQKSEVKGEGWLQHWYNCDYEEKIDLYKNTMFVGGQCFTNLKNFDFEQWKKEEEDHIKLVAIALKKHKEIYK